MNDKIKIRSTSWRCASTADSILWLFNSVTLEQVVDVFDHQHMADLYQAAEADDAKLTEPIPHWRTAPAIVILLEISHLQSSSLKHATHITETGTSRLVPETCTRVSCIGQSGTRFCWYQFLVRNRTQLYSITETVWHVTQTVQRDWPVCCYCFCCH